MKQINANQTPKQMPQLKLELVTSIDQLANGGSFLFKNRRECLVMLDAVNMSNENDPTTNYLVTDKRAILGRYNSFNDRIIIETQSERGRAVITPITKKDIEEFHVYQIVGYA